MIRKLTVEYIDTVYKAALENQLEAVTVYKNDKGRSKGQYMIDFKIANNTIAGYIDTSLHDIFKAQLLELRVAVTNDTLTDVDIAYIVTAKHMKINIKTKP